MLRWAIASSVALIATWWLSQTIDGDSAHPFMFGHTPDFMMTTVTYLVVFGWWLDHLTARTRWWGSLAIHGGASLILATMATVVVAGIKSLANAPSGGIPSAFPLIIWLLAWPLAYLAASLVKDSFRPKHRASR